MSRTSEHVNGRPGIGHEAKTRLLSQATSQADARRSTQRDSPCPAFPLVRGCLSMVGDTGFEPVTSSVSTSFELSVNLRRGPSEHEPLPHGPPTCAQIRTRCHSMSRSPGRPVQGQPRHRPGGNAHAAQQRAVRGVRTQQPPLPSAHRAPDRGVLDAWSGPPAAKGHHQPIIDAMRTGDVDRARACLRLTWRPQPTSGARRPRRPDGGGALRRLPLQSAPCVDHGPSCAAPRFPLSG